MINVNDVVLINGCYLLVKNISDDGKMVEVTSGGILGICIKHARCCNSTARTIKSKDKQSSMNGIGSINRKNLRHKLVT